MDRTKIQIMMTDDREDTLVDDNLPRCPLVIFSQLQKDFDINYLMRVHNVKNNDEHIGYIRGVLDVLARVELMTEL